MSLTVAEWHEESQRLRAAGLDGLADFYAANARLVRDGEPPVWPIPAALRASAHIAEKPAPEPQPFASDAREEGPPR